MSKKYVASYESPAAPLVQSVSSHRCIACGEQHIACCGQCIKFVPSDGQVPCPGGCGHWVCNEGLAEYLAERGVLTQ